MTHRVHMKGRPGPYKGRAGPRRRCWGASGTVGVYLTRTGTYQARLRYNGTLLNCGNHATVAAATAARAQRLEQLEGSL